jgi:formate hydrogenlyase subunit 6/NADH:ubiquinone oxidoreductase subunit I
MAYTIDLGPCINCGLCRRACPTETIRYFTTGRRTHVIDPSGCISCDLCAQVCPVSCIAPDPAYVHDPEELAAAKQKAKAWARRRREQELAQRAAAQQLTARLAAARR